MLICTWLGFFRAEKGCRVEGKKFRRAGNFRKHSIPCLIKDYPAPMLTRSLCGLGEVTWGHYWASVFSSEKENADQISSQAQSLCQPRIGSPAVGLLSEDGLATDCPRCEED